MPRTWVDGMETVVTDTEWARHAATFLGCGFRVVVPGGPVRPVALAAARLQARRIAELFDATFDDAPWQAVDGGQEAVELVGGWRHQFRGPAGSATTRVSVLPESRTPVRRVAAEPLPWPLNAQSPLTGLPMVSGFEESRALSALEPGTLGLWWNTDGHLVSSTAGPLLLRVDGQWLRPAAGGGTVPHFVWVRTAELLAADDLLVDDEVVAGAQMICAVDAQGTVSLADCVAGSTYELRETSLTDLVGAVDTVLGGT